MVKALSPTARRRSIAVLNTNSPARRKRRASSFGITDKHRLLAPRKSILKLHPPLVDEDVTTAISVASTATGPRKSLKPRVSFATHAHVRLFEKKDAHSQSSSPSASPAKPGEAGYVNDENAYPGASVSRSRRSSLSNRRRSSISGAQMSDDDGMDLDSSMVQQGSDDTNATENLADLRLADSEADDMDATMMIHKPRRSSFAPSQRRPSDAFTVYEDDDDISNLEPPAEEEEVLDVSAMNLSVVSHGDTMSFEQEHEEYAHPIDQVLNPPKAPSAELLALAAMTHSGQMGYDNEEDADVPAYAINHMDDDITDMSVEDAVSRLNSARQSMAAFQAGGDDMDFVTQAAPLGLGEDSFSDGNLSGNMDETVNVTTAFPTAFRNRASSFGIGLSDMDADLDDLQPEYEEPHQGTIDPALLSGGSSHAQSFHPEDTMPNEQPPSSTSPSPPLPEASTTPAQEFAAEPTTHLSLSPSPPRRRLSLLPEPRSAVKEAPVPVPPSALHGPEPSSVSVPARPIFQPRPSISRAPSTTTSNENIFQRQSIVTSSSETNSTQLTYPSAPTVTSQPEVSPPTEEHVSPPSAAPNASPAAEVSVFSKPRHSILPAQNNAGAMRPMRAASLGGPPATASIFRPRFSLMPPAQATTPRSPSKGTSSSSVMLGKQLLAEELAVPEENLEDPPTLTMEEFLELIGIQFMDNITVPRRSVASSGRRRSSTSALSEPSLSDYFLANALHIPQLMVYGPGVKHVQEKIDYLKVEFARTNEEVKKLPPEVFATFLESSDEDKIGMMGTIQKLKVDTRELAKVVWYEARLDWVQELQQYVSKALETVDQDAEVLSGKKSQLETEVQSAEDELEKLLRELELEQTEVDEIEASDKPYLQGLKEGIQEQATMTEELERELAQHQDRIRILDQQIAAATEQDAKNQAIIAEAERLLNEKEGHGMEKVEELKDKLELLHWLHGWRCLVTETHLLELVFDERYHVIIPQRDGKPDLDHMKIGLHPYPQPSTIETWLPGIEDALLRTGHMYLLSMRDSITKNSEVTQLFSSHWTRSSRLCGELDEVAKKWPCTVSISSPVSDTVQTLTLHIPLLFHKLKAKSVVTFTIGLDAFCIWPDSAPSVRTEVTLKYGKDKLQSQVVLEAVEGQLQKTAASWDRKPFLDALSYALTLY